MYRRNLKIGFLIGATFAYGASAAPSLNSGAAVFDLSTSDPSCEASTTAADTIVTASCVVGGLSGSASSFVSYGSAGSSASLVGIGDAGAAAVAGSRWTERYMLPAEAEFVSFTFAINGTTTNAGLDFVTAEISLIGEFSGELFGMELLGSTVITTGMISADTIRSSDLSTIFRSRALLVTPTGAPVSGEADFAGMLRLTSVNLFNASGEAVSGPVIGESGTIYPTSAATVVPEPASLALCGGGLLLLCSRTMRVRLRNSADRSNLP